MCGPYPCGSCCLYLGCCRGVLEWVVDNLALPCLRQTSCGACLTTCCQSSYSCCDEYICCMNNRPKDRQSNTAKAIIVFSSRTVKDVETYKAAFSTYATALQSSTPGVRACFSFMDREHENTAFQFFWYDSAEVYTSLSKENLESLQACYTGSTTTDYCVVYGGWNESFKKAMTASDSGVKYDFGKEMRGFLRDADPKREVYPGPPMIWVSKRRIKPGRMNTFISSWQKAMDLMYDAAPGMLGSIEFTAQDEPDQLWSIRYFQDYEMGHVRHFPKGVSYIPPRVLFTMIPEFGPGPYPVGLAFTKKEDIDAAVAYNPGNSEYTPYCWDDGLIGPLPSFRNDTPGTQEMARLMDDKL